ncbi:hypothetical protein [Oceanicoccus sp. KOV_DT_Chl]|uniref:hypothetical protein n=1 Tax=Oceanicoccus sp. KOV_DT_Chl TaxID=1904639 RepID=UPI000C7B1E55|nr:hypothetical protein [Oceanicoccus sp. KOV_DT_Chl]
MPNKKLHLTNIATLVFVYVAWLHFTQKRSPQYLQVSLALAINMKKIILIILPFIISACATTDNNSTMEPFGMSLVKGSMFISVPFDTSIPGGKREASILWDSLAEEFCAGAYVGTAYISDVKHPSKPRGASVKVVTGLVSCEGSENFSYKDLQELEDQIDAE